MIPAYIRASENRPKSIAEVIASLKSPPTPKTTSLANPAAALGTNGGTGSAAKPPSSSSSLPSSSLFPPLISLKSVPAAQAASASDARPSSTTQPPVRTGIANGRDRINGTPSVVLKTVSAAAAAAAIPSLQSGRFIQSPSPTLQPPRPPQLLPPSPPPVAPPPKPRGLSDADAARFGIRTGPRTIEDAKRAAQAKLDAVAAAKQAAAAAAAFAAVAATARRANEPRAGNGDDKEKSCLKAEPKEGQEDKEEQKETLEEELRRLRREAALGPKRRRRRRQYRQPSPSGPASEGVGDGAGCGRDESAVPSSSSPSDNVRSASRKQQKKTIQFLRSSDEPPPQLSSADLPFPPSSTKTSSVRTKRQRSQDASARQQQQQRKKRRRGSRVNGEDEEEEKEEPPRLAEPRPLRPIVADGELRSLVYKRRRNAISEREWAECKAALTVTPLDTYLARQIAKARRNRASNLQQIMQRSTERLRRSQVRLWGETDEWVCVPPAFGIQRWGSPAIDTRGSLYDLSCDNKDIETDDDDNDTPTTTTTTTTSGSTNKIRRRRKKQKHFFLKMHRYLWSAEDKGRFNQMTVADALASWFEQHGGRHVEHVDLYDHRYIAEAERWKFVEKKRRERPRLLAQFILQLLGFSPTTEEGAEDCEDIAVPLRGYLEPTDEELVAMYEAQLPTWPRPNNWPPFDPRLLGPYRRVEHGQWTCTCQPNVNTADNLNCNDAKEEKEKKPDAFRFEAASAFAENKETKRTSNMKEDEEETPPPLEKPHVREISRQQQQQHQSQLVFPANKRLVAPSPSAQVKFEADLKADAKKENHSTIASQKPGLAQQRGQKRSLVSAPPPPPSLPVRQGVASRANLGDVAFTDAYPSKKQRKMDGETKTKPGVSTRTKVEKEEEEEEEKEEQISNDDYNKRSTTEGHNGDGVRLRQDRAALQLAARVSLGGYICIPTGTGKTALAMMLAARAGLKVLYVVGQQPLISQTEQRAREYLGPKVRVGRIHQQTWDVEDKHIVVGMLHSLLRHTSRPASDWRQFDLVILDEVHMMVTPYFRRVLHLLSGAPWLFGLSATPERTDGMERLLPLYLGPPIFAASARTPNAYQTVVQRLTYDPLVREQYMNPRTQEYDIYRMTLLILAEQLRHLGNVNTLAAMLAHGRRIIALCSTVEYGLRVLADVSRAIGGGRHPFPPPSGALAAAASGGRVPKNDKKAIKAAELRMEKRADALRAYREAAQAAGIPLLEQQRNDGGEEEEEEEEKEKDASRWVAAEESVANDDYTTLALAGPIQSRTSGSNHHAGNVGQGNQMRKWSELVGHEYVDEKDVKEPNRKRRRKNKKKKKKQKKEGGDADGEQEGEDEEEKEAERLEAETVARSMAKLSSVGGHCSIWDKLTPAQQRDLSQKQLIYYGMWLGMEERTRIEGLVFDLMIATFTIFSTGVDRPEMDTLYMLESRRQITQAIGRVGRPSEHLRQFTLITDVCDQHGYWPRQSGARKEIYKKKGFTIAPDRVLGLDLDFFKTPPPEALPKKSPLADTATSSSSSSSSSSPTPNSLLSFPPSHNRPPYPELPPHKPRRLSSASARGSKIQTD